MGQHAQNQRRFALDQIVSDVARHDVSGLATGKLIANTLRKFDHTDLDNPSTYVDALKMLIHQHLADQRPATELDKTLRLPPDHALRRGALNL